MKIHLLIALHASVLLHEAAASALDLYSALGLLLDVFHVLTSLADDLCPEIETRDRLEFDRDALFRPFAATERIAFDIWFRLATSTLKAALVDQVWEFLLHELVDLLYGLLEAFFGR
jgi:hypothetical protein